MTTKKESVNQEEMSPGTFNSQSNPLNGHFQSPVPFTSHGIPNQGITFIQHIYPPAYPVQEKESSTSEETMLTFVFEILKQFSQLTPEEQSIILKMVKDSSITSPKPTISSLVKKIMLGMVKDSSIT